MKTKPFDIPKQQVMQAYRLVFAVRGPERGSTWHGWGWLSIALVCLLTGASG